MKMSFILPAALAVFSIFAFFPPASGANSSSPGKTKPEAAKSAEKTAASKDMKIVGDKENKKEEVDRTKVVVDKNEAPPDGEAYKPQVNKFDLDGDGVEEIITLEQFKKVEAGDYFHLVVKKVKDGKESLLWKSPDYDTSFSSEKGQEYRFFIGDPGIEDVDVIGDIDGDGKIELVSAEMQSDVSPTSFRVYRWTGKEFKHLFTKYLFAEEPSDPKNFAWGKNREITEATALTWAAGFGKVEKPGVVIINVTYYKSPAPKSMENSTVKGGIARAGASKNGFKLMEWTKKLGEEF